MRVFFHLADGTASLPDNEGIEVESIDQARTQMHRALTEFKQEQELAPGDLVNWRLTAEDATGAVLFTLNLEQ
jgi:Domain of unknown function (DUF6894)